MQSGLLQFLLIVCTGVASVPSPRIQTLHIKPRDGQHEPASISHDSPPSWRSPDTDYDQFDRTSSFSSDQAPPAIQLLATISGLTGHLVTRSPSNSRSSTSPSPLDNSVYVGRLRFRREVDSHTPVDHGRFYPDNTQAHDLSDSSNLGLFATGSVALPTPPSTIITTGAGIVAKLGNTASGTGLDGAVPVKVGEGNATGNLGMESAYGTQSGAESAIGAETGSTSVVNSASSAGIAGGAGVRSITGIKSSTGAESTVGGSISPRAVSSADQVDAKADDDEAAEQVNLGFDGSLGAIMGGVAVGVGGAVTGASGIVGASTKVAAGAGGAVVAGGSGLLGTGVNSGIGSLLGI